MRFKTKYSEGRALALNCPKGGHLSECGNLCKLTRCSNENLHHNILTPSFFVIAINNVVGVDVIAILVIVIHVVNVLFVVIVMFVVAAAGLQRNSKGSLDQLLSGT